MLENIRCAFKLHLKLKNFKVNYDKIGARKNVLNIQTSCVCYLFKGIILFKSYSKNLGN